MKTLPTDPSLTADEIETKLITEILDSGDENTGIPVTQEQYNSLSQHYDIDPLDQE